MLRRVKHSNIAKFISTFGFPSMERHTMGKEDLNPQTKGQQVRL
jgi:hypothetical protein